MGAAVVIGAAGLGTTTAKAAQFGFHERGAVAYVPPCPGPGYEWVEGYMENGYWVDGYWNLPRRDFGPVVRYGRSYDRDWDRDRFRGHDRDRGWEGDRGRDRGWNNDRDRDRGWDHDRDRGRDRDHEGFRR